MGKRTSGGLGFSDAYDGKSHKGDARISKERWVREVWMQEGGRDEIV